MAKRSGKTVLRFGLLAMAVVQPSAGAQNLSEGQQRTLAMPVDAPAQTLNEALARLSARAGLIFVGTVERIDRLSGAVEVTLRVEQAIQGQPGPRYVLREWAGRWPLGVQRYTPGERAVFFLNTPSPAGFSSPVDGGDGVVPVFGDPISGAVLDTRRLSATLGRQLGDKLPENPALPLQQAVEVITTAARAGVRRPVPPSGEEPLPILVHGGTKARVNASAGTSHAQ